VHGTGIYWRTHITYGSEFKWQRWRCRISSANDEYVILETNKIFKISGPSANEDLRFSDEISFCGLKKLPQIRECSSSKYKINSSKKDNFGTFETAFFLRQF
jgi:hypothetical protein